MSEIQFLLDENVDPDILLWCEANQFSLITNNRHTMPLHLQDHLTAGRHVPGIFILNDRMSIGQTVLALSEIWSSHQSERYMDQIIFLKPLAP